MPAAFFAILLGLGMALGLAGKYPFGGAMRQQFLLFLFALLAGFLAFDRLARSLSAATAAASSCRRLRARDRRQRHPARREDFRPRGPEDFAAQTVVFESAFPGDRTVQVDQLNLIGFFITHHDWNWKFDGREPANWAVERYLLEKGARRYTLIAHRDRWNFDFQDAALYPALRSALHAGDPPCFSVFCVHTNLYKPPATAASRPRCGANDGGDCDARPEGRRDARPDRHPRKRRLRRALRPRLRPVSLLAALGRLLPREVLPGAQGRLAHDAVEVRKAHAQRIHPAPEVRVGADRGLPGFEVVSQKLEVGAVQHR